MSASLQCCSAKTTGQDDLVIRDLRDYLQCQFDSQKEMLQELFDRSKRADVELAAIRHFMAKSRNPKQFSDSALKAKQLDARGAGFQGVGEAPRSPEPMPLNCTATKKTLLFQKSLRHGPTKHRSSMM